MQYFRFVSLRIFISSVWVGAAPTRAMSINSSTTGSSAASNRLSTTSTCSKIAVGQLCSISSKLENLLNIAKCAGWAKRENCSMLFLPECFGFMSENSQQTLISAEPPIEITDDEASHHNNINSEKLEESVKQALEDMVEYCAGTEISQSTKLNIPSSDTNNNDVSLLAGLKIIARKSNLWISGGGMHVSGAPPVNIDEDNNHESQSKHTPRVYNTHVIIDNDGTVQCHYRKIHLFDVSIPGKVNLRESATTAPGTELKLCNSPIGRLGVTVCYDVRFPETYVELVRQGAQVILVPAAFTVPTGSAHWHTLLKARAIETQCYVIAAAQFGKHNEKRESYGHSLVVDPWGEIVVDAGGYDGPGTTSGDVPGVPPTIVTCEIDLTYLKSIRQRIPVQEHRANAIF